MDFDADLSKYGIKKGVNVNEAEREVYAPVAMWLEAVDLVLDRLKAKGTPFGDIRGISGSGQQHGSVYWSESGERSLGELNEKKTLAEQMGKAFADPFSPNWQDASTQRECDEFEEALGNEFDLAKITGSRAHHVSFIWLWASHCVEFANRSLPAVHWTPNLEVSQEIPKGI